MSSNQVLTQSKACWCSSTMLYIGIFVPFFIIALLKNINLSLGLFSEFLSRLISLYHIAAGQRTHVRMLLFHPPSRLLNKGRQTEICVRSPSFQVVTKFR